MIRLYQYIKSPRKLIASLLLHYGGWLPDSIYLKWLYRQIMGRKLNLENPQTFSEKLQWLKLFNREPGYTNMVDKYAVKDYVAGIIGEEYIIPTLGVWDKIEDIEWDNLPAQFVLKTTHGGGGSGVVICRDKSSFNREEAIRRLRSSMHSDIYKALREWPYKNVPKRIIAEQIIGNEATIDFDLRDYKFFCFNGRVKFFKIDFDRFKEHHANYYDTNGSLLPFGEVSCPPRPEKRLTIPSLLPKMVELAERISVGHPFMRVDLYLYNESIYFGEITFFPAGGMGRFSPEVWDKTIGDYLDLSGFSANKLL